MADAPKKEPQAQGHSKDQVVVDKASPNNIQDQFLNNLRRERTLTTIFLVGGVKLTGKIKSFDKYAVVLENNNQEQLIFKHAISTIAIARTAQPISQSPQVAEA
jgi:host factor-I protein